jgi:hypothetical protein
MIQRSFADINIEDLLLLINNKVPEGKTIEYKAELKIEKDAEKKEFLYDVSSFANTTGGDLIFGISESSEKGIPGSLIGIAGNMDEIIRKIDGMIRTSINPRISGVRIKFLPMDGGNSILLMRISKSINAPHQVTFQGVDRFYCRSNNGKYILDVFELRDAFLQSSLLIDKVRQFVNNRVSRIIADDTPVRLDANPKIILHIVPLQAMAGNKNNILYDEIKTTSLFPLGCGGYNYRFNLDGVLNFSRPPGAKVDFGYLQVYRNGIIESVNADLLRPFDGKKLIYVDKSFSVEQKIIATVLDSLSFLKKQNVSLPIYLFLSLIDVLGYGIGSSRLRESVFGDQGIDREVLVLPEIEIQSYSENIATSLKEWFEAIWNASGFEKCLSYDAKGNFTSF